MHYYMCICIYPTHVHLHFRFIITVMRREETTHGGIKCITMMTKDHTYYYQLGPTTPDHQGKCICWSWISIL